jgi:Uma2 family endonuclease
MSERWASIDVDKTPIPLAPDIAVEVLSPSERTTDTMRKVWTYLGAGTLEVWQFEPESQKVLIYRGAKSITVLEIGESLNTPLLPDWEISVREIFSAHRQP